MADRIPIAASISIDTDELEISYIRSPGPGGQNVNKVASAAQLRFNLRNSPSLPEPLKLRAMALAGTKLTNDGILVITASRHRAQPLNREDAIARLVALLAAAAVAPKPRRVTRPPLGSKRRRVDTKVKRGMTKLLRAKRPPLD